jgi:hypothetical protein
MAVVEPVVERQLSRQIWEFPVRSSSPWKKGDVKNLWFADIRVDLDMLVVYHRLKARLQHEKNHLPCRGFTGLLDGAEYSDGACLSRTVTKYAA